MVRLRLRVFRREQMIRIYGGTKGHIKRGALKAVEFLMSIDLVSKCFLFTLLLLLM